jgi:hypothetical protein
MSFSVSKPNRHSLHLNFGVFCEDMVVAEDFLVLFCDFLPLDVLTVSSDAPPLLATTTSSTVSLLTRLRGIGPIGGDVCQWFQLMVECIEVNVKHMSRLTAM